ncbi:type IX secretion system protein PorQ [Hallella multisaccharivorax]|uniref:type IX secretion system protein PorQ n=1 Tax=Hallella multisaccharivorax TaxID=310514 RepID=UPI00361FA0FF
MKKAFLVITAMLLHFVAVWAQNDSQTGYNFLRLPVSAHAAALGGDNISVIDDDEALIFSNPALLSSVSDKSLNLNYMSYMEGAKTASASFNRTVKDRASWAVSAQYLDYGRMKETDETGLQTGDFSAKDISLSGYFAYLLTDRLSGGIATKLITSYIADYNSVAVGVDLGLNYYDPDTEWSLSVTLKNLGGELKAYNENYNRMPFDIQAGVSKRFANTPLRMHVTIVDINHPHYKLVNHLVAGADALLSDNFWIGIGYNFRRANEMKITDSDNKSNSHGAGLSLGAGLTLNRFKAAVSWGKYHVSSSGVVISVTFCL